MIKPQQKAFIDALTPQGMIHYYLLDCHSNMNKGYTLMNAEVSNYLRGRMLREWNSISHLRWAGLIQREHLESGEMHYMTLKHLQPYLKWRAEQQVSEAFGGELSPPSKPTIVDEKEDDQTNPSHYDSHQGASPIDALISYNLDADFCKGNIVKYTLRAEEKNGDKDMEKALWYAICYFTRDPVKTKEIVEFIRGDYHTEVKDALK